MSHLLLIFLLSFIHVTLNFAGGVAWSSGQHRRLPFQGSRDRIPVVPLSFICSGPREKKRKTTNCEPKRRDATEKGGSGEKKKKDRQAFQEKVTRKAFGSFRRRLNG